MTRRGAALLALALTAGGGVFAEVRAQAPAADPAPDGAALVRNARSPGVTVLPGLQYRVLEAGPASGARPSRSDVVTVRYTGRFLDGRVFSTSAEEGRGLVSFPLQKLIPGWLSALQLMRPGDRWRLWLPPHLAYGWKGKDYIPPDATLVFDVELVSFAPAEAAPPGHR